MIRFELVWDDSNQAKNGRQFMEPEEADRWTSVHQSCVQTTSSFRRLGDANKSTSSTELPGLEAPLALLQLKLWGRHHKAAKLPPALHRL